MVPVVVHEVNDFSDVPSILEGPIHIVDRDGSRDTLGVQVLGYDLVDINKPASGPQVDKGIYQQWGIYCLWHGYVGGVPSLYRV